MTIGKACNTSVHWIKLSIMRRDIFLTLTFVNDQRVLQKAIDLHNGYIAELNGTAGGNWTIVTMFQPIPTIFSQHSLEKGGNVLGLDRATQNLVCKSYSQLERWVDVDHISVPNQSSMATSAG